MSEVRAGYRQTELGLVPEDWDIAPLGSIGKFRNGINKPKDAFGSGYPFVNLMDVFGVSKISASNHLGLIETSEADRSTYDLKTGDVLFIRSSVKPSGVGLTTVVAQDLPLTVYSGFLLRFRDQGRLTTEYKAHCFHNERFRSQIIASSTVSANTNINQSALKNLSICYPPSAAEQQAIAEALGDADALIEGLEALIIKKRGIKQGAMQELLSGNRRLPGFQGIWSTESLGKLGQWRGGATPTMSRADFWDEGTIPWVSSSDVRVGVVIPTHLITEKAVKESSTTLVVPGTILFVTRSGILRRFLPVALAPMPIAINQDIKALTLRKDVFDSFVFHALVGASEAILASCMKSGTTVESIELVWLKKFEIAMPPTLDEQRAIASVLSDMDAEIAALEDKLAKARAFKQGMMQVLLTGEIRLI